MAIRSGMQNIVDRVRKLTKAGTAEYTAGTTTYWTDTHIQDVLDSSAQFFVDSPLTWLDQTIEGSTITYLVSQSVWRDLEEAESGTARWVVRDTTGSVIGTADYSTDYRAGRLTFTSDQGGTAYYLTGFTYDVNLAAADLWAERLAYFNEWYDFSADNQSFSRSQAFDHACKMEKLLRSKAGLNVVGVSGDLRTSQYVRVDINV